jgi:hypothetical protein
MIGVASGGSLGLVLKQETIQFRVLVLLLSLFQSKWEERQRLNVNWRFSNSDCMIFIFGQRPICQPTHLFVSNNAQVKTRWSSQDWTHGRATDLTAYQSATKKRQ